MADASSSSPSASALFTVYPYILHTHILTRLDGAALASTACASSQLRLLSSDQLLWRDICVATWPSVDHPLVSDVVSAFPSGHRSFYSDSFPLLDHRSPPFNLSPSSPVSELISAVDIFFQNRPIFTKVLLNETESSWFRCSPFRVDLLDPNESIPTPLGQACDDEDWLNHLEENLMVSWIVIDPKNHQAANISSRSPVSVQRRRLTGEIELRYSTIMAADKRPGSLSEFVQCGVVITCVEKGGGMELREMSMQIEDMEGKHLSGKESVIILQEAMETGMRKKGKKEEGKEIYEEFLKTAKERKQKKQKTEKAVEMFFVLTAIAIFVALWSLVFWEAYEKLNHAFMIVYHFY